MRQVLIIDCEVVTLPWYTTDAPPDYLIDFGDGVMRDIRPLRQYTAKNPFPRVPC